MCVCVRKLAVQVGGMWVEGYTPHLIPHPPYPSPGPSLSMLEVIVSVEGEVV